MPSLKRSPGSNSSSGSSGVLINYDTLLRGGGKGMRELYMTENFLENRQDTEKRQYSTRELRKVFTDVGRLLRDSLEVLHIRLEQTTFQGYMLASTITPQLHSLHVESGLVLSSQDDRQTLGHVIYEHDSLTEISLRNLTIQQSRFSRWLGTATPPLDILVPAFNSIVFLSTLEIDCHDEDIANGTSKPATVAVSTPMDPQLSTLAIKELCLSPTLRRLNLSRVGLTDDHFAVIAEELTTNASSGLTELILNENENTDQGIDLISTMFFKPAQACPIQRFEAYQERRVVDERSVQLLCHALYENANLTTVRIHTEPSKSTATLDFYLQLNQAGRKCLVEKTVTSQQWIKLLSELNDEPDFLFYCLRKSGFFWRLMTPQPKAVVPEPVLSPKAAEVASPRSATRLLELTARHSGVVEGMGLLASGRAPLVAIQSDDELSDIEDLDDDVDEEEIEKLHSELAEQNLPHEFDFGDTGHDSRLSVVTLGDRSYIQDLMSQKERQKGEFQEEAMEEALELLDDAIAKKKIPIGMDQQDMFKMIYQGIAMEREKEEKDKVKKLDGLLERALKKAMAREQAAIAKQAKAETKA